MMITEFENYTVILKDEPTYSRNSTDNPVYQFEYCRCYEYQHACAHGIRVRENEEYLASAVLLGVGGATGINDNSMVIDEKSLYVAAGDSLYCLQLPDLKLNWCVKVDFATCFGVFLLEKRNCLLTWGELFISCYSKSGQEVWSCSGRDIFTEGLELKDDTAVVTDFCGDKYNINLDNGAMSPS